MALAIGLRLPYTLDDVFDRDAADRALAVFPGMPIGFLADKVCALDTASKVGTAYEYDGPWSVFANNAFLVVGQILFTIDRRIFLVRYFD